MRQPPPRTTDSGGLWWTEVMSPANKPAKRAPPAGAGFCLVEAAADFEPRMHLRNLRFHERTGFGSKERSI